MLTTTMLITSQLLLAFYFPQTMAVSLEALAMAGADSDSRDYCLTIEEWERKYILKPAPHLLSPRSSPSGRREKISCKNYPLFLFFPKKHGKVYDCSREEEEEEKKWPDYGDEDEEGECRGRGKRKKGSMAKGFREFGDMPKRVSCKIIKFFSGAIKKNKSKSLCS